MSRMFGTFCWRGNSSLVYHVDISKLLSVNKDYVSSVLERWIPPMSMITKTNIKAAFKEKSPLIGIGVIAKNKMCEYCFLSYYFL